MKILTKVNLPIHHPFLKNRYTEWYYSIIYNAKNRKNQTECYTERHHIIPESMFENRIRKGPAGYWPGNPNIVDNIVKLTAKEHLICHLLLTKMVTGVYLEKMIRAVLMMTVSDKNQKRIHKITSKTYAELRSAYASMQREKLKGKPGRPHSDETKQKLSNINKGKKLKSPSTSTKEKISAALTGRTRPEFSDQWKLNLSIASKGRKNSSSCLPWWNNGQINKRSSESPGPNWVKGQLKKSKISRGSTGMSWWNNGLTNKLSFSCPGEEWEKGRIYNSVNR